MTDPAQVRDLVAAALDRHKRIDGLVNNAGASLQGPLAQGACCAPGRTRSTSRTARSSPESPTCPSNPACRMT
ncbi:MAG TPA: hypothetical protein VK817_03705 [Trebonia sp.]|nr:hypothetical protein [Trebonia sp.]